MLAMDATMFMSQGRLASGRQMITENRKLS